MLSLAPGGISKQRVNNQTPAEVDSQPGRLANMYTGTPAVCLVVSTVMYDSFDPRKKGPNHDFN